MKPNNNIYYNNNNKQTKKTKKKKKVNKKLLFITFFATFLFFFFICLQVASILTPSIDIPALNTDEDNLTSMTSQDFKKRIDPRLLSIELQNEINPSLIKKNKENKIKNSKDLKVDLKGPIDIAKSENQTTLPQQTPSINNTNKNKSDNS